MYCPVKEQRTHISVCLIAICKKRKKCESYKTMMENGETNDDNGQIE